MSVCLSGESSLFVGPPDPQKEDFHVFSADQLAEMILDSIQKTLQMDFTGQGDNPDAIDIYYYMEGEQPLELPNLGLSWSLDEPYQCACISKGCFACGVATRSPVTITAAPTFNLEISSKFSILS